MTAEDARTKLTSLTARTRDSLARTANVEERTLFGCACFFLNGNVLAGVWNDALTRRRTWGCCAGWRCRC